MANSKKWSEQTLTEQSFTNIENGNEVQKTLRVLDVCTSGMELYRKHFTECKYKEKNELIVPYDMVVLLGDFSPRGGRFYELEYTLGDKYGIICRALIQAVNPVTDIRLIIGGLQHNNVLPKDLFPHKAHLTNIDYVHIGGCYNDPTDGICFSGGMTEAKDGDTSVLDYLLKNSPYLCLYYYRGDHREVWLHRTDKFDTPDIFVCGSDNVNDPVFAEQRAADLDEMREYIAEAVGIAEDYGLNLFFAYENGEVNDEGKHVCSVRRNGTWEWFIKMLDYLMEHAEVVNPNAEQNDGN